MGLRIALEAPLVFSRSRFHTMSDALYESSIQSLPLLGKARSATTTPSATTSC
jgi:hypothetical protein